MTATAADPGAAADGLSTAPRQCLTWLSTL